MADINSSFDEILTELGDSFDADIAASGRKITRSTANKIWLMLRAFARGLYGLYQVVAALKYRFDPLYCTDEELESTMRLVGTSLMPGKTSLLTVTIWNNHATIAKSLPIGTYSYISANGVTFTLLLQDILTVPANSFVKKDFYSSLGGQPYIGAFIVSDNSDITVVNEDNTPIDSDISFSCEDNTDQLGRAQETMFEARQRILSDNQRQEIMHILEERLRALPNVHECTIIGNPGIEPIDSPYMKDDGITHLQIMPQSLLIIMTGSPTADFALQFLTLCPFITTPPAGVSNYGVVYHDSAIYLGGRFPVYYVPHRIKYFDINIEYGYSSRQVSQSTVEAAMIDLLQHFKASTQFKEVISTDDFTSVLLEYKNPAVKLLSVSFVYNSATVNYMQFDRTQIARLQNINFTAVSMWT